MKKINTNSLTLHQSLLSAYFQPKIVLSTENTTENKNRHSCNFHSQT